MDLPLERMPSVLADGSIDAPLESYKWNVTASPCLPTAYALCSRVGNVWRTGVHDNRCSGPNKNIPAATLDSTHLLKTSVERCTNAGGRAHRCHRARGRAGSPQRIRSSRGRSCAISAKCLKIDA